MKARQTLKKPRLLMDDSMVRLLAPEVFESLNSLNLIGGTLDRFLLQYPHYEKIRMRLKSECELSCAACAIVASYLGAVRPGRKSLAGVAPQVGDGRTSGKKKKRTPLDPGLLHRVQSYITLFEYMTRKSDLNRKGDDHSLSALSAIAFSSASHALGRDCHNVVKHQDINHLIHDLLMPVLIGTFQHFRGR